MEDKIWREIEITDRRSVTDLDYAILATYHFLAYHLYDIEYNNKFYDCWICIEDDHRNVEVINVVIPKLVDMKPNKNDTMKMKYDMGSTTTFIIKCLGDNEFKKGNGI